MDSDRVAAAAKQVKGSVKEAIGKLTGDTKVQAEGAAEKAEGQAEKALRDTEDK
ncbi:CsbD family protein [Pararoseomonas sp. SCSIO 73927]|uniref:CsbD family protein n=1 Tax=Pararoseomonas sp. SCSIO 73927 TaxID=3114537 RepID=UPI0030D09BC6